MQASLRFSRTACGSMVFPRNKKCRTEEIHEQPPEDFYAI
jgi:hypothetical protein